MHYETRKQLENQIQRTTNLYFVTTTFLVLYCSWWLFSARTSLWTKCFSYRLILTETTHRYLFDTFLFVFIFFIFLIFLVVILERREL